MRMLLELTLVLKLIGSVFRVEQAVENVRSFGSFTADLYALADWLQECKVETVAMESTGVYWIALFQILEIRGFEVKLVNAHHVKTLPSCKSDVLDCQWIQQLHSYGLLSASFRPDDQICVLRSYIRQRDNLVRSAVCMCKGYRRHSLK